MGATYYNKLMTLKYILFCLHKDIRVPLSLREYYVSLELIKKGWSIYWCIPRSGSDSSGLSLNWPVLRYPDLNIRGHKFLVPMYLALLCWKMRIKVVWISGWFIRDSGMLKLCIKILKFFGLKVVYDPIDPIDLLSEAQEPQHPRKKETIKEHLHEVYYLADIILAVTPEIADHIGQEYGIDKKKIFVARWGTDASIFSKKNIQDDFRKKLGMGNRTFLVGWLGSMSPFKGLLEIMIPLVEATAYKLENIHFVIAGGGLLEKDVEDWVRTKKLPVTLIGHIPYREAPSFTKALDVYIVPTNPLHRLGRYVCPVKCFDAVVMGTTLITTETKATQVLTEISKDVFLCEFKVQAFQSTLERVYKEWQERGSTKPSGEVEARSSKVYKFTHQHVAKKLAQTLDLSLK